MEKGKWRLICRPKAVHIRIPCADPQQKHRQHILVSHRVMTQHGRIRRQPQAKDISHHPLSQRKTVDHLLVQGTNIQPERFATSCEAATLKHRDCQCAWHDSHAIKELAKMAVETCPHKVVDERSDDGGAVTHPVASSCEAGRGAGWQACRHKHKARVFTSPTLVFIRYPPLLFTCYSVMCK